ncbi:MAG: 50S ribosomal protein L5 [Pseudomonadota bacterium]
MAEEKKNTKQAPKTDKVKEKKDKAPKIDAKVQEQPGEAKAKPKKEKRPVEPRKPFPFEKHYLANCVPALQEEFKYKNKMEIPRLVKIVVNTCIKEALQDRKILETAAKEIEAISGQKPIFTKAKKSIANFKLRKGAVVGASVTLRGGRMYEFMNRLVNVALPRVRDFKGVSFKAFDGRGNYTLGLTEQIIFPEINYDKVTKVNGMNVTFVTSAKTDEEGKRLLDLMGMPFRKQ